MLVNTNGSLFSEEMQRFTDFRVIHGLSGCVCCCDNINVIGDCDKAVIMKRTYRCFLLHAFIYLHLDFNLCIIQQALYPLQLIENPVIQNSISFYLLSNHHMDQFQFIFLTFKVPIPPLKPDPLSNYSTLPDFSHYCLHSVEQFTYLCQTDDILS